MRYAAYFVLFIGTLFGWVTLRIAHQEYRAQHDWPVAPGEVEASEEQSRVDTDSHNNRSTLYWTQFRVLFDPPPGECGAGMLWGRIGGPTRCIGVFNTPEGSREDAYHWTRRHPVGSHVQVHYEPHGRGVRFAGESIADTYPWKKILVTFVIFFAGSGLLRLARSMEENRVESSPANQNTEDTHDPDALVELNLH